MILRLSNFLPTETFFSYLSSVPLCETDSNDERSVYRYECGCVGVRNVSDHCTRAIWCSLHRPTST